MADYRESTISGEIKTWTRAYKIEIDNSYLEVPSIRFLEERKTTIPGGKFISESAGAISEDFDPSRVINLINPIDGSSLGQASLQQLQLLLYSYYMDLVNRRDNP